MNAALRTCLIVAVCLALWPALAAAQPPKPAGPLVYEDDFSDSKKSGLEDDLQATDFSRGFHPPGVYHLILFRKDDTRWVLLPDHSYANFSVELDLIDDSDAFTGGMAHGVVFRAQDDTHFYALLIDPRKGEYSVRKLNGQNKWSDLVAWKASPLIKQQDEANRVRVDAAGDKFSVYLNGETLASFSDASYAKGSFGMIASNVDASKPHSHFDNLKIFSTEGKPLPAPAAERPAVLPGTGQPEGAAPMLLAWLALILIGLSLWLRPRRR